MNVLRLTATLGVIGVTVLATAARRQKLPDPEMQPVMKAAETRAAYGLGESAFYDAVNRGEIPHIRFGRRLVFPTAAIRRHLGLDGPEEAEAS
jgi:hypothetical protein